MAYNKEQWKREKGSSRNYRNVDTGEIISRRQYDKLKGGPVQRQNQTAVKLSRQGTKKYNALVRDRTAYLKEQGIKTNFNDVRKSDEMKSIISRLKIRKGEFYKDYDVNKRRFDALKETGRIKDHVELYILSL